MEKVTPYFGNFNQSECIQYLSDVAELCKRNNNENLTTPLQALTNGNTNLVKAFKKDSKSNITKRLTQYDQRRDNAIVCLRLTASAYNNHYNEETRNAAEHVLRTIDKYGKSLHKLNYQAETSVLSNLYIDLTSEKMAPSVAKIQMTDVVEEMNTANSLFNETYLARVEESAAQEQVATGEMIKETIAHYRHLVAFIEAYHIINPAGGFDMLLKQINELATKYNSLVSTSEKENEAEQEPQVQ